MKPLSFGQVGRLPRTLTLLAALAVLGAVVWKDSPAAPAPIREESDTAPVALSPGPDLSEPTPAKLDRWIGDVEREIARLKGVGKKDRAERFETQLRQFKGRQAGRYPGPLSKRPELHVVGIYEGAKVNQQQKKGIAAVEVTYTSAPVVLVLCAYDPIAWTVRIAKGVELKQVIVGGYHDQEVAGVPDNVPVRYRVHERMNADYFYCYKRDARSFLRTAEVLHKLAGCEITTFQGAYRYSGMPVVVGPENPDWRIEHILWDMRELHEAATRHERQRQWQDMQKFTFQAVHFAPKVGGGHACSFGEFTPTGPLMKSLKPIDGYVSHLAADPRGPARYAFAMHEVGTLDPETGRFTSIPFDRRLPEVSWPCAIAFDSKRGRLLWDSFGGGGFLYAYDVKGQSWSVVTKPGLGVWGLIYNPDDDLLYGVKVPGGEDAATWTVSRFNARGGLVDEVKVSEPIPSGRSLRVQLALAGKRLVVIVPPGSSSEGPEKPLPARTYVIDPTTGEVVFACAHQPHEAKEGK